MDHHHRNKINSLTPKEMEVLKCIKQGKCTAEIADTLSIQQSTVKFHVRNIKEKLKAANRAHAIAIALEKGLFDT